MKVILLKDVAKIGRRFEVCEVPDGYALNRLIPQGMAQTATPENLKKVEARAAKQGLDAAAGAEALTAAVAALKAEPLQVAAEANEQEHLFEAIKPEAVVAAAAARDIVLTADQVAMVEPIKSLGEHVITLTAGDVTGDVTVVVVKK